MTTWRKWQKYSTFLNFTKWIKLCNIIYLNDILCNTKIPSRISFLSDQHSNILSPAKRNCMIFRNVIYLVAVILMELNRTFLDITLKKQTIISTVWICTGSSAGEKQQVRIVLHEKFIWVQKDPSAFRFTDEATFKYKQFITYIINQKH